MQAQTHHLPKPAIAALARLVAACPPGQPSMTTIAFNAAEEERQSEQQAGKIGVFPASPERKEVLHYTC